jgi:dephospho-CoA kinase
MFNPNALPAGLPWSSPVRGPLRVGITGGIGSGKSTVARFLGLLGAPLYNADARAKALMAEDGQLKESIIRLIGPSSYHPDGRLNRAFLAERTFHNLEGTLQLNALVHPAVAQDYEDWASQEWPGVPYTVKEAAILLEAGSEKRLHFVVHVSAPEALRLSRTLARDPQRSAAQVQQIMAAQWPEARREAASQYIIQNTGEESIIAQVLELDAFLRRQAADRTPIF